MSPTRRQRTAIAWLCAAAMLLLGFIAQQHALSHALTMHQSAAPHDPVAGHAQVCDLCLQLAGADAALSPATLAIAHDAEGRCDSGAAALPWRVEAFVAYASRAPPQRG
ncbi:MAG: hypothetical protein ACRC2B_18490 [Rubrivivax sp.]